MGPDSDSPANRTSRFRPQLSLAEELARAQTFTGANGAALATLDGDKLIWLGAVGQNPPKTGDRWSLAGSFATLCLGRRTRPQRCDDVEVDGRVDASFRGLRAKSLALAPVHDEAGKVTGILAVFSDNSRAFNGMHTAVLQTEADSLAELVQQARRAVGIQDERAEAEQAPPHPVKTPAAAPPPAQSSSPHEFEVFESAFVVVPPPVAATPAAPAVAPPPAQTSLQHEFEAFESAFVVVPPPVAATPAAPAAGAAPPVPPTAPAAAGPAAPVAQPSLPKLKLVPAPAPAHAPAPGPAERPTLPGFMPLSATAAALAKAKPVPPMPAEMVVERKAHKPAAAPPQPAVELKNPGAPWLMAPRASVPTPPPAPVPVVPQAPAPASVTVPRRSAAGKTPRPAPALAPAAPATPAPVKFVPLAKPSEVKAPAEVKTAPEVKTVPEVKTPPPGTVKPVSKAADQQQPLPAAADPFAEYSPVFVRAPARTPTSAAASRPTFASLEAVGSPEPSRTGLHRLLVVAAVVVAVVGGGLWLRARSHAAKNKPAPVVTQPAAAPVAASQVTPPSPPPASPVSATPAPVSQASAAAPAVPAASSEPQKLPDKSAPAKPQAVTATATRPPAPSVTAPAPLDLKTPAPVATPVVARAQEPAPQTLLSVPAASSANLPDLPKPEAPAAPALRRISTTVPARLLHSVAPIYPATAKAMNLEGVVRVTAKVNAQGRVTEVVWGSGNGLFRDNAISAVRQWRYQPASLDGQPVDSTVEIVLKFTPR